MHKIMPQDVIYLATPFTSKALIKPAARREEAERWKAAAKICGRYFQQGNIVYSPVVHWYPVALQEGLPGDYETWKRVNQAMLDRCDVLVVGMLPGYDTSRGVAEEIEYALNTQKPVIYLPCENSKIG